MADIETLDLSEHTSKAEGVNGVQDQSSVQGSSAKSPDGHPTLIKLDEHPSLSSPASPSPGSGLVPLCGTTPNGTTPGASTVPTLSVPHPKKFTHININKKFLEKTSSGSGSGSTPSNATNNKTGTSSQKPASQSTASHSRLVTAKLTAGPQPSTLTGPGWSRPSSTGSTVAPTPNSATNPKPSPLLTPAITHAAPIPTPVGKVIHPQPRPPTEGPSGLRKENGNRPVWGNTRLGGPGGADSVQSDFPTAAEVAQVRSAKLIEKKQAAQAAAAQKQALAAEADAFRGVHLGSGHHWDEDEEDDDNFLGGVIEFGDGRQYTIPTEPRQSSPPRDLATDVEGETSTKHSGAPSTSDHPVSKEERFADDFDRSWPRSRGPGIPPHREQSYPNRPPSSASSQPLHSPQEGSRALFNERLNRLEPYSNQPHRFSGGREPFPSRRDSRSDYTSSPTESRSGRDLPPHTGRGVQLLQKSHESPVDSTHRSRVFGDRPGFSPQNDRFRDKEPSRRDYAQPPHTLKSPQSASDSRPRDHYNPLGLSHLSPVGSRNDERPRRLSTGPDSLPPLPGTETARADGRQIPPHLSALQVPPPQRGPPSAALSETTTGGPPSTHPSAQSPAASFASVSPLMTESPLHSSAIPLVDLDDVRKAAMHSAAERAKLRRQQEEEEREKERERARRKAAELEAKMKVTEAQKTEAEPDDQVATEVQVIEIIESAVQSVTQAPASKPLEAVQEDIIPAVTVPPAKTTLPRPLSTRGGLRPTVRRPSFPAPNAVPDATSPATDADSWRSKAAPPRPMQRPHQSAVSPVIPLMPPPPVVFAEVESLTIRADEEVEVVDFSELGKLVGMEVPLPESSEVVEEALPPSTRPSRPVATDFFEDSTAHAGERARADDTWRRKPPIVEKLQPTDPTEHVIAHSPEKPDLQINPPPPNAHIPFRRLSVASDDHPRAHPPHGHPRSPLTPSYREAPMSALDDTMARIRGAMNGLQQKAEQLAPKPHSKWLPPALRARSSAAQDEPPREVFDVTVLDPPRSPKPAWNQYVLKFPSISHPVDPVSKKQMHMSKTVPHVRADIFSWDPPIDGMNRRDFHLNDILFRKPFGPKGGRIKYTVLLPRLRIAKTDKSGRPVVNLPPARPSITPSTSAGAGAFGKKKEADEASSWRKSATPLKPQLAEDAAQQELNTTSRSPPPETSNDATPAPTSKVDEVVSPTVSVAPVRTRSQPKMPEGSDVAFYRDSRSESISVPNASVNFIVNSELEEAANVNGASQLALRTNGDVNSPATSRVVLADNAATVNSKDQTEHELGVPTLISHKAEIQKAEISVDTTPISPPSINSTPWTKSPRTFSLKDSPARPPDREHLKAVWETTSNKAESVSVNSLERIGDDMTAVPFTILDIKSEDGKTPPPTSSNPPSRMSQHDVTRAFQQVPTSSATNSGPHRAAPAPAPAVPAFMPGPTSPPSRQPSHSMALPPHPNTAVRPMYPGYPPLMGSPSPTMMYPMSMTPSPIPRPMVVNSAPQYPQAMWVPVPGPPGPTHSGMMRPGPHYGAQLMPYPPPPPPGMYAPHPAHAMQGNVPQPQNGVHNRPNGMPIMSPITPQAHAARPHPHTGPHPVYAQSPVLVHTPASAHPGHGYPNANQPPRGQMRGAYDHAPPMMPSYSSSGPHSQAAPTYTAVPSNTFDRPW